ncbi:MAG: carboxypeptidase-like regulatory domain-containing protein [Acidobacteriia bacterium]|nr:carboxypeptidase-like regulatory domain-containing protein [Terriglobia bacterium]
MLASYRKSLRTPIAIVLYFVLGLGAHAQSGSSTSVSGTILDPSGAVVPNATVEILNPVSAFDRTTLTDSSGKFTIPNVPFNPYHLTVMAQGFTDYSQDIGVRSAVPVSLKISLTVGASNEVVKVEAAGEDLLENTSSFHTDVDRGLFDKIPIESQSSSVSRFPSIQSSRWRSSPAPHLPNLATRLAW